MKSTKIMFEDLGSLIQNTYNTPVGPKPPPPKVNTPDPLVQWRQRQPTNIIKASGNELNGVKLFDFSFRPWQSTLINSLQSGNNVYQVASPGAGKTAPVIFHWAKVLGLNPDFEFNIDASRGINYVNTETIKQVRQLFITITKFFDPHALNDIQKVLYLCPVRQLVYEVRKEFKQQISKMFYHMIHIMLTITNDSRLNSQNGFNIDVNVLYRLLRENNIDITRFVKQRQILYKQMNHINKMVQNNPGAAKKLAQDINVIDQQIFETITKGMSKFIDDNIVCMKTEVDQIRNKNAPIVICIYESGAKIFDQMKNGLRLIIVDEAHLIQQVNIDDDRTDNIVDSLYHIFSGLRVMKNSQLILLSGTVNPISTSNLIAYLDKQLDLKVRMLTTGNAARNPSNVSVLPMDSLTNNSTLLQIMLRPTENNNIIILFSKNRIDNLVQQALKMNKGNQYTADQIQRGDIQSRQRQSFNINLKDLEPDNPDNISKKFGMNRKQFIDAINKMPEVNEIHDETLLQCVLNGFGYIYRQDSGTQADKRNAGQDAQIVAHLFSKGKIRTLLATDAVGIGINLTIRNMYIPSLNKFDGGSFKPLLISNASQLFNRTGRMAFAVSSIYTPRDNVEDVVKAISASNNQFDMRKTLSRKIHSKINSKQFFRILWYHYVGEKYHKS